MTDDQRKQTDRDNLADLIHEAVNAGGDDLSFDLAYSIAGCFVGSEWLKEHVAAARREALLEAGKVARVEALAEEWRNAADRVEPYEPNTAGWLRWGAREIGVALAEPERGEEGGR